MLMIPIKRKTKIRIKLFFQIFFVFLIISVCVFYYFYNIYEKRNSERVLNISPKFLLNHHYDNFNEKYINIINERKKFELNNAKRYTTEEISSSDYILVSDFARKYISEVNKKYQPLVGVNGGTCEIEINLKSKKYSINDCNNDFIFKRSVEIAVESMNDDFYLYKDVNHLNKNIKIYFNYK